MSTCESLTGNADFYGLGIRIGIYLQWGSAWLSLLLDPESAQGVLDANSVSLFAVAIATVIAARRNAPAIEMYIMLQILLGFPVTTLSSFGFRLWLMSPRRLDKLCSEVSRLWREARDKRREAARQREQRNVEARQRRENRRQELQLRSEQRRASTQNSRLWNWVLDRFDQWVLEFPRLRSQPAPLPQPESQSQSGPQPRLPRSLILISIFLGWIMSTPIGSFIVQGLYILPVALPLRFLSSLKFPGLSWSGVLWRATTVALVMAYNVAYWFDEGGHGVQEQPSPGCGPPTVFMFSEQPLGGPIITLGRTAAVFIAAIVGPPTVLLMLLTLRIFMDALIFLYRDAYFFVTSKDPQSFKDILGRVNHVLDHRALAVTQVLESYSQIFPFVTITGLHTVASMGTSFFDIVEFMSDHGADSSIRFSDVIKVGVSLCMGKPVKRQSQAQATEPRLSTAQTMPAGWRVDDLNASRGRLLTWFCVAWNVGMVLSIAWFITSIETTIRWNNIQGVGTIDSTGQLIPFLIGCVSASQVLKKVILLALGKKYPDWVDTDLEIQDGADGPRIWEIVKRSGPGNGTTTGTAGGNVTAGNDPNQTAIPLTNLSRGSSQSINP